MAISVTNKQINDYLTSCGVSHSNLGYIYLMDCIRIMLDENTPRDNFTILYEKVAAKNSTRPVYIERYIRFNIKHIDKSMTVKNFILCAVDALRFEE